MDDAGVGGGEKYSWRENGESPSQVEARRLTKASRNKICTAVRTKYPKKSMCTKAMVLSDLISHFAKRNPNSHSACREALQNKSLHIIKKPKLSVVPLRGESIKKAAAMLLNSASENQVSELVTVMKSSKFKITDQRNAGDLSAAQQGISSLSCYDKTPRELRPEIGDCEPVDCYQPEVTRKLEDISIECDFYDVSGAKTTTIDCDEICKKVEGSSLHTEALQICDYSSRFRPYCTNTTNPELNANLEEFVSELSRLQRNLYKRDKSKGRFRRRYYAGFREIEKRLQLKKIKLVIVAPDIDTNKNNGELDKLVGRFKDACGLHEVPCVFGLSRRKLGYLTHGKGFVSSIGVANYEALEDKLGAALVKVADAKNQLRILKGEPDKQINVEAILENDLLPSERVKVLLKTLAVPF
ncbi:uncharacterized protein LOC106637258 [Copidosoma floridanum]|uniref:uncharacterized protein LOC106637258 n=1 Tax=Copidosoma floridanum TaxID=29053 RepID=UPI0006C9CFB2|nr:uncharacterized protein LOC106637258 [Copidosoma floridanum]